MIIVYLLSTFQIYIWRSNISIYSDSTIRAAVIGLGVGEQHALEYKKLDKVDLITVADTNLNKAEKFAMQNNIPNY